MSTVSYNKFIFSDEKKHRLQRHIAFWAFWGFYFGMVRELNPRYFLDNGHFPDFGKTMAQAFVTLAPQAILVYPLLNFILPRYAFYGRYITSAFLFIALLLITISINAILLMSLPWYEAMWGIGLKGSLLSGVPTFSGKFLMACLIGLQGSLSGTALAACFKMFKHHYVKDINNQQLLKENIESQLQLLKAQVHPHFLFNTLNNIFSQTQTESPRGSKMIMGLSDMLRYILYEGQKPLVPLKQELIMIVEYIDLERMRYGNRLDVHIQTPKETEDLFIAPLLLLPFVENCFKHGASNILEDPWINLTMELKDTTLVMKLMNGKAATNDTPQREHGIGIRNVQQRLELLYTNKYELEVREEEDVFVVDLSVELVRMENPETALLLSEPKSDVIYA
jgi:sensor histidine kinase YesM